MSLPHRSYSLSTCYIILVGHTCTSWVFMYMICIVEKRYVYFTKVEDELKHTSYNCVIRFTPYLQTMVQNQASATLVMLMKSGIRHSGVEHVSSVY